ncbi:MAG TPA: hypothetical protein VK724_22540 [Bryobacteraceae bacterium]|jgi:hypothetical protein|nr:hypothetical protein [Bryobacteraceae bacterium]
MQARYAALVSAVIFFATSSPAAEPTAAKSWLAPRTPDGQPDLQGVWTNSTLTPLERPAEFAGKPVLSEQEAADYVKQVLQQVNSDRRDGGTQADVGRSYNEFWRDRGNNLVADRRTSLIVDPPDGKVPPLTPEAQKRVEQARAWMRDHSTDGPEGRSLAERCISWTTAGPPMLPGPYNNDLQILQAPGYVVILNEMIHDTRLIPLDGRPHVAPGIRELMGDSRGHWEGDTLVVDTTNFNGEVSFRGSDANLHLTERFTRVSPDVIRYEFTIDDSTAFIKPWTARIPLNKTNGPVYEYACHEGNYAMVDILAGARAAEKKSAK